MGNIIQEVKKLIKYTEGDLNPNHETISIYIKNQKNEVLIQYHNKFNFWIIPVGKIDAGETPEIALKKEAKEELDITITKFKILGTFHNTYLRNGINVNIKSYLFEVLNYNGQIKNKEPHKHRELKFVPINELKKIKPMPDAIKDLLKVIK